MWVRKKVHTMKNKHILSLGVAKNCVKCFVYFETEKAFLKVVQKYIADSVHNNAVCWQSGLYMFISYGNSPAPLTALWVVLLHWLDHVVISSQYVKRFILRISLNVQDFPDRAKMFSHNVSHVHCSLPQYVDKVGCIGDLFVLHWFIKMSEKGFVKGNTGNLPFVDSLRDRIFLCWPWRLLTVGTWGIICCRVSTTAAHTFPILIQYIPLYSSYKAYQYIYLSLSLKRGAICAGMELPTNNACPCLLSLAVEMPEDSLCGG